MINKVKTAILMLKSGLTKDSANELLKKNCGVLRRALKTLEKV